MKKTILIIGILLISLNSKSQNQESTLYFRNGEIKKGLTKIISSRKVKFRYHKKSAKEIYDYKVLKKIEILEKGDVIPKTYMFKLIKPKNSHYSQPALMEPIVTGKMNLYMRTTVTNGLMMPIGYGKFGGIGGTMTMKTEFDNYYVCKDDSDIVIKLATIGRALFHKNFIKSASEYFKDCPILVDKIKNKTFKKRDIKRIVRFYNSNCNK